LAEYPSLTVGHDTLVPVSAPDAQGRALHTLASGKASLLAYSVESGLGHMLQQVMGERIAALHLPVVFTAHLASVLKTMALDGRGMAWLPETLVADELAQGRLLRSAPPDWDLMLEIRLFRDLRALGSAPEAFWAAVQRPRSA
jgi:LysR family transcriptional regulator, hypochlorite-specific transcription factor HypT